MSFSNGTEKGVMMIFFLIGMTLLYIFFNIAKFFYNKIFGTRRTVYNMDNEQDEDIEGEVECAICMSSEFKDKVELVCSHCYCGKN